jgi:hypothetical protein
MQKRKLGKSNLEVSAMAQEELKRIDEALAQIAVAGDRYPALEKRTGL